MASGDPIHHTQLDLIQRVQRCKLQLNESLTPLHSKPPRLDNNHICALDKNSQKIEHMIQITIYWLNEPEVLARKSDPSNCLALFKALSLLKHQVNFLSQFLPRPVHDSSACLSTYLLSFKFKSVLLFSITPSWALLHIAQILKFLWGLVECKRAKQVRWKLILSKQCIYESQILLL